MEFRYDNSAANVRNPQLPPVPVRWGQRSTDEMGDLWFQLLADSEADRGRLEAEVLRKMTAEDIVGHETMLRTDPRNAELHDDVAVLYLDGGRAAEAVRHFEAVAALRPTSAAACFNLGTALAQTGRLDEAAAMLRTALERQPEYPIADINLGRVLLAQGRVVEALHHLQRAVRLDGFNGQALLGLAEAFAAQGELRVGRGHGRSGAAARVAGGPGAGGPGAAGAVRAAAVSGLSGRAWGSAVAAAQEPTAPGVESG